MGYQRRVHGELLYCSQTLTMISLAIILVIGCVSAGSYSDVTCEECQQGTALLAHHFLSDESLAEQGGLVKDLFCSELSDPTECEADLDMWFPVLAGCLYPHLFVDGDLCSQLGLCKKVSFFSPRDITCDECVEILPKIGAYMSEQETITDGMDYLKGDCFCGQEEHIDDCDDFVSFVLPVALPVIATSLVEQTNQLRSEVGVCG